MPSLNFLSKSLIAIGVVVGSGAGIVYGFSNSSTKDNVDQLSIKPSLKSEESDNSLAPLDSKSKSDKENFVNREEKPEGNALSEEQDNFSQLKANPLHLKDSEHKLRGEGKNNPIEKQNPSSVIEKKTDLEISFPSVNESSRDSSLPKNYFLKGEKDFLEQEEWSPEECEWVGSDSDTKLKCKWSNGEIRSNSREVIFNFSEKDIIDNQLNNSDIRNKITEIDFEPLSNGGELSLIFDSHETVKIRLEHKNSSSN